MPANMPKGAPATAARACGEIAKLRLLFEN
jgi:hypothetical protein